jgi:2-oxoglutarate ferredoxin oxidoreductase subunit beta
VARSFSGDAKQLVPLIQAALKHKGTAFIDVFSPCIAFNNHDGSTKSYNYIKAHDTVLQELGYFAPQQEILADYNEGTKELIDLPDGSKILLNKIDSRLHNLHNRIDAMKVLTEARHNGEILTGLFYIDETQPSLIDTLSLTEKPLSFLTEADLKPTTVQFQNVMSRFS